MASSATTAATAQAGTSPARAVTRAGSSGSGDALKAADTRGEVRRG